MDPTDPSVRRFLARSMITRVAARTPAGRPFITPYWFVHDGAKICITTGQQALLVRYLEADPRAVLLFEADRDPALSQLLRLSGTARVYKGIPRRFGVLLAYARKYILSPGGLRCELAHLRLLGLRRRFYAQSSPAWIEVTPETAAFFPRLPAP